MRALLLIAAALAPLAPASAVADEHLGAEQCAACHPEAYAWWKTTAHARASASLNAAERRDPRCTGCHATAPDEGLMDVQCEACHGPGRHYWPRFVMLDRHLARAAGLRSGAEPSTCIGCHTADAPTLRPFDLPAALAKMRVHRLPAAAPSPSPTPAGAPP